MSSQELTPLLDPLAWVGPSEAARLLDFVLIEFCINELDPDACPNCDSRDAVILLSKFRDACQAIANGNPSEKGGNHE